MPAVRPLLRGACAALALLAIQAAWSADLIGAQALRTRHATLGPHLASNAFGGPLVLQWEEIQRRIDGDVYAVLDHPFAQVAATLADAAQWCDMLILHLNVKHCQRVSGTQGTVRIDLRVGKKHPQAVQAASLLALSWRPPSVAGDYVAARMDAAEGPFDTRDYRLLVEAVPIAPGKTFLHLGYAFSYGGASHLAMHLYLATIGRDKVGFTRAPDGPADEFVGGMRGVVERNTMRYFLAIDAYLGSLALPAERRLEHRLAAWFDATERYPRQLREVDRTAYLEMKRAEVARLAQAH